MTVAHLTLGCTSLIGCLVLSLISNVMRNVGSHPHSVVLCVLASLLAAAVAALFFIGAVVCAAIEYCVGTSERPPGQQM